MRRTLGLIGATCLSWAYTPESSATSASYYTLEDLGPLGGQEEYFDFPVSGIRCRAGSANDINADGDIVATRIDGNGQWYVTVNDQVLPAASGPAIGCAISDDGFVAGADTFGGKVWMRQGSTYIAYGSYIPPSATKSLLLSIGSPAPYFISPHFDLTVAGIYETPSHDVRLYVGNRFPNLAMIFSDLSPKATIGSIRQEPPNSGRFFLAGGHRSFDSDLRPFEGSFTPYSTSFMSDDDHLGVYYDQSAAGVAIGCTIRNGLQEVRFANPTKYTFPLAWPLPSCAKSINEHEVAAGYLGSPKAAAVFASDGAMYKLDEFVGDIPMFNKNLEEWSIDEIVSINNSGVMAANGTVKIGNSYERHVVRLIPTALPVSVKLDGDWETHPSQSEPFLRSKSQATATITLDRPVPAYDAQNQQYLIRIFGRIPVGGIRWVKVPPQHSAVQVSFFPMGEVAVPTRVRHIFELNGVHAEDEVLWVASSEINFCDDGIDNDLDGAADCDDDDCDGKSCLLPSGLYGHCQNNICTTKETACDNYIDDDFDGLTDCEDPDCRYRRCGYGLFCLEQGSSGFKCMPPPKEIYCHDRWFFAWEVCENACYDNYDQDQDGPVDCADPDCLGRSCSPDGGAVCGEDECFEDHCYNGVDDDNDGPEDCEDIDCDGRDCSPFHNGEAICQGKECIELNCCNLIDDDDDGLWDCQDPDCYGVVCPHMEFEECVCMMESLACETCWGNCTNPECHGVACGPGLVCRGIRCW